MTTQIFVVYRYDDPQHDMIAKNGKVFGNGSTEVDSAVNFIYKMAEHGDHTLEVAPHSCDTDEFSFFTMNYILRTGEDKQ